MKNEMAAVTILYAKDDAALLAHFNEVDGLCRKQCAVDHILRVVVDGGQDKLRLMPRQ